MSFQVSLKVFSIQAITRTQKACQQYEPRYCACRMHTSIWSSALKFLSQLIKFFSNALQKNSCILPKKHHLQKNLQSGSTCLLNANSPPGFLSLRKTHSRIPHVANSLLDCEWQAVQLNTDCWICLQRIRNAPSPRKSILLFSNMPCIWKGKSLSPKDSIWTSANEQKFTTAKWLLIQQTN